ncbi:MAG: hypothetical protein U5M23_09195 [Marinagarivorans sp.]|nr:hypothetical protein [Marinagarivorans sp.]
MLRGSLSRRACANRQSFMWDVSFYGGGNGMAGVDDGGVMGEQIKPALMGLSGLKPLAPWALSLALLVLVVFDHIS